MLIAKGRINFAKRRMFTAEGAMLIAKRAMFIAEGAIIILEALTTFIELAATFYKSMISTLLLFFCYRLWILFDIFAE